MHQIQQVSSTPVQVSTWVAGAITELRLHTLAHLTSAEKQLERKSLIHERSQKDKRSSGSKADGQHLYICQANALKFIRLLVELEITWLPIGLRLVSFV